LNFDSPSIPSEKEEESEILWENVTRIEKIMFLSVLEIMQSSSWKTGSQDPK
jgi:hypothetical protein